MRASHLNLLGKASSRRPSLEHSHDPQDIAARLSNPPGQHYLKDAIYGAVDGAVTTFAVVSGVAGAGLSSSVVLILGIANLAADGFSMAAANFLGTRAENQRIDQLRAIEREHIAICPEGEREEVRQIFKLQGFEGELLDATVKQVTENEEMWIETMLRSEYGVSRDYPAPLPAALITFASFCAVGLLPLLPFVANWIWGSQLTSSPFLISAVMTSVAFLAVGGFKAGFVRQHWAWSAMETLLVGSVAAGLAYLCGYLLGGLHG